MIHYKGNAVTYTYITKLTNNKCLSTPVVHVDDGYSFPQLCKLNL